MQLPQYLAQKGFTPAITEPPAADLHLVVTIPCYHEPRLLDSLEALWQCERPAQTTEVIVAINHGSNVPEQTRQLNAQTLSKAKAWIQAHRDEKLRFFVLYFPDLPAKKAGVGLARQLAMDEAYYRLYAADNPRGTITGFDADSTCSTNYMLAISEHYSQYPKTTGTSVYFAHPLSGTAHNTMVYQKIRDYELYLRYYRLGLACTGFPYAFHTLGSSFTVRADVYAKQGGMNKRRAGEDFYFLHKIFPLGNFYELTFASVYPSPRPSHRVPFGTGAAIRKMLQTNSHKYLTYNPQPFVVLQKFLQSYPFLMNSTSWKTQLPKNEAGQLLLGFLETHSFTNALEKIRRHSSDMEVFSKRFFSWFTAFRILKFMNYAHEKAYSFIPVAQAADQMLDWCGLDQPYTGSDAENLLHSYRSLDQKVIPEMVQRNIRLAFGK